MNGEKLDQVYEMVTQLIRVTGHTNAIVEETLDRVDRLEKRFDGLEQRFDGLEQRFDKLEQKVDKLEVRIGNLETKFDRLEGRVDDIETRMATKEDIARLETKIDNIAKTQDVHAAWLRNLSAETSQHQAEIDMLKKAKVG